MSYDLEKTITKLVLLLLSSLLFKFSSKNYFKKWIEIKVT